MVILQNAISLVCWMFITYILQVLSPSWMGTCMCLTWLKSSDPPPKSLYGDLLHHHCMESIQTSHRHKWGSPHCRKGDDPEWFCTWGHFKLKKSHFCTFLQIYCSYSNSYYTDLIGSLLGVRGTSFRKLTSNDLIGWDIISHKFKATHPIFMKLQEQKTPSHKILL